MSTSETLAAPALRESGTIYNRIFWMAYAANVSLVSANAITFRFAELVKYLGGTEEITGAIVSTGMFAALLARFVMGQSIDRYGVRRLWPAFSLLFIIACGLFLMSGRLSWGIYAARIAFSVGLAGMFTCSMVHIQNHVPIHRRTEIIGMLGSSGFLGMIVGTQLGDAIFNFVPAGRPQFVTLFGAAAALGVFYLAVVAVLSRTDNHTRPGETPAAHRLLIRYWPGNVLLVAVMAGVSFAVITVFLTRFATEQGLGGIGTFFTAFSVTAFIIRMSTRRWSQTIGRHRLILIGLVGQSIGLGTLPFVSNGWHFIGPAIACGCGHALLFPSVVSLGAGAFPPQYRGTGTTIVLGFTELGVMLCARPLGWIIDNYGFAPMFRTASGMAICVGVIYALTSTGKHDDDIRRDDYDASNDVPEPHMHTDDEADEKVSVPFPQLGRSA